MERTLTSQHSSILATCRKKTDKWFCGKGVGQTSLKDVIDENQKDKWSGIFHWVMKTYAWSWRCFMYSNDGFS